MNEQEVRNLVLQYLPIFYFHEDEHYGPMSFDDFVMLSDLCLDTSSGSSLGDDYDREGEIIQTDSSFVRAQMEEYTRNSPAHDPEKIGQKWRLFLNYAGWGDGPDKEECNPDRASQRYGTLDQPHTPFHLYAHVAPGDVYVDRSGLRKRIVTLCEEGYCDEPTRDRMIERLRKLFQKFMVISYGPFYCMQDSPHFGGWDYHEGDMEEAVTVIFDYKAHMGVDYVPRYVAYKRHGSELDMRAWDGAVEEASGFAQVERTGDHPHGWVAGGSHATYPARGYYSRRWIPNEVFEYYSYIDPVGACALWIATRILDQFDILNVVTGSDDDDATGGGRTLGEPDGAAPWEEREVEVIDRFNSIVPWWWDLYKGRMGLKVKEGWLHRHTSSPRQDTHEIALVGGAGLEKAVWTELFKDPELMGELTGIAVREAKERAANIPG